MPYPQFQTCFLGIRWGSWVLSCAASLLLVCGTCDATPSRYHGSAQIKNGISFKGEKNIGMSKWYSFWSEWNWNVLSGDMGYPKNTITPLFELILPFLQCMYWINSIGMTRTNLFSATLDHFSQQLNRLVLLILVPKSERKIGHADQRVWMLKSQHSRPRLHKLHPQLLGLLPPALIPKCRCKVSHAGQHVWMLKS